MRLPALLLSACIFILGAGRALAQPADCNQPAAEAIYQVRLSGHPFSAIPTADGCAIFVSLTAARPGDSSQIAVLARAGGKITVARTIAAAGQITGMALSPDGRVLAAADDAGVTLFDTQRLIQGAADAVLARGADGAGSGAVYAAFSPDGRFLAISDEQARAITLYDFAAFTKGKPLKAFGRIPVGYGPTGLVFSPDSKRLYAAVQVAAAPGAQCPDEAGRGQPHAGGELVVIDAGRAASSPGRAVLAEIPAGCNPVRVALSPSGDRAYVSIRGSNAVASFDTARLVAERDRAATALFKVGKSPVGVTATDKLVFVTNSDRFGSGQSQTVSAIDTADPTRIRSIPAAGFPRELKLTADFRTLLITNFDSGVVELVDLARL
jgi:DNA-binding beta-propeller fold protein YncE